MINYWRHFSNNDNIYCIKITSVLKCVKNDLGLLKTISDLINYLITKNESYKKAFNDISTIRFSKNMNLVNLNENINNNDEIAFFPPVTGG